MPYATYMSLIKICIAPLHTIKETNSLRRRVQDASTLKYKFWIFVDILVILF
jgi:hypothetical protein